jgi:hypothetical protein
MGHIYSYNSMHSGSCCPGYGAPSSPQWGGQAPQAQWDGGPAQQWGGQPQNMGWKRQSQQPYAMNAGGPQFAHGNIVNNQFYAGPSYNNSPTNVVINNNYFMAPA